MCGSPTAGGEKDKQGATSLVAGAAFALVPPVFALVPPVFALAVSATAFAYNTLLPFEDQKGFPCLCKEGDSPLGQASRGIGSMVLCRCDPAILRQYQLPVIVRSFKAAKTL